MHTCMCTLAYVGEFIYKHIHSTRATYIHAHIHARAYTRIETYVQTHAKGRLTQMQRGAYDSVQDIQESLLQLYRCTSYTHYLLCVPATVQSSP